MHSASNSLNKKLLFSLFIKVNWTRKHQKVTIFSTVDCVAITSKSWLYGVDLEMPGFVQVGLFSFFITLIFCFACYTVDPTANHHVRSMHYRISLFYHKSIIVKRSGWKRCTMNLCSPYHLRTPLCCRSIARVTRHARPSVRLSLYMSRTIENKKA